MKWNYTTIVTIYLIFLVEFSTSYEYKDTHYQSKKLSRSHNGHQGKHHNSKYRDNNSNETTTSSSTTNSSPTTNSSSTTTSSPTTTSSSSTTESLLGLKVVYNTSVDIVAFYNVSQTASAVFNYSSGQLFLLNGKNGSAITIDLLNQTIGQIDSSLWQSSKENFDSFFKNISSLNSTTTNHIQNLSNPSQEILHEITRIGSDLGVGGNNSSPSNSLQSLQKLLKIAHTLSTKNPFLIPLLKSLNNRELVLPSRNGLERFAHIIEAIARLFTLGPSLWARLIEAGLQLDLSEILNSSNGFEAFLKFIQQVNKQSPIGQIFGPVLNNLPGFLGVVNQFSGGNNNSADNSLKFLNSLVSVIEGQNSSTSNNSSSSSDLIQHLLKANESGGFGLGFLPQVSELLNLTQNDKNAGQLEGFTGILKDLLGNNLVHRGINLSKILELARKGDFVAVCDNVARILIQLNKLYNPFVAIPLFVGRIIFSRLSGGSNDTGSGLDDIIKQFEAGGLNLTNVIGSGGISNLTQFVPFLGGSGGLLPGNGGFSWEGIIKGIGSPLQIPGLFGPGPVVPPASGTPESTNNNSSSTGTNGTTEASSLQGLVSELLPKLKHNLHKKVHHFSGSVKLHHHHKDENSRHHRNDH